MFDLSMDIFTFAGMKIYQKLCRIPTFNMSDFPLYMSVLVPFAAWSLYSTGVIFFSLALERDRQFQYSCQLKIHIRDMSNECKIEDISLNIQTQWLSSLIGIGISLVQGFLHVLALVLNSWWYKHIPMFCVRVFELRRLLRLYRLECRL